MHRLGPAVVAFVLAAAAAGCGSDDDEASTSNGFADGYSVTAALAELPYAEPRGRTQVIVMTFTAGDVRFFTELRDSLDRFSVQTLHEGVEVSEDLPTTDGLRTTCEGESC